mgnify:CR=1 FL=1
MKVTKKAINAVLPSRTYFTRHYMYRGFTGIAPSYGARTLMAVIFRVKDDGGLHETDYGYGDAWTFEDYNAEYSVDATEIIEQWMKGLPYEIDRKEVVDLIQQQFAEIED